jgi:uncharacterized membrane protein
MGKGRLEAFSDGVLAVIITIMVLEIKAPHGADVGALSPLGPTLLSYAMSFVYVGIYWNNHHHMLHAAKRVSGPVMWANLHLLFWLSLVPVVTNWVGEHADDPLPTAVYGGLLFVAGVAYLVLARALTRLHGEDSPLARAVGRDVKGQISAALYASAIGLAFVNVRIAQAIYVLVALMWLVPDRRIERELLRSGPPEA